MDLSGSLQQNSLEDIFPSLAKRRLSGTLTLQHHQHRAIYHVREGLVCSLTTSSLDLVQFVQKYREEHPTTSIRMLLEYAETLIVDHTVEIFQWQDADYFFQEKSPRKVESVLRTPREGSFFLERAKELHEGWSRARPHLPAQYMFLESKASKPVRDSLSKDEMFLLSHIRPEIPVRDLQKRYPKGKYHFLTGIHSMMRNGFIEVLDPSALNINIEENKGTRGPSSVERSEEAPASTIGEKSQQSSGSLGFFRPDQDEIEQNLAFLESGSLAMDDSQSHHQTSGPVPFPAVGKPAAPEQPKKKKRRKKKSTKSNKSSTPRPEAPKQSQELESFADFSMEEVSFDNLFTEEGLRRDRGDSDEVKPDARVPTDPAEASGRIPPPASRAPRKDDSDSDVSVYFVEEADSEVVPGPSPGAYDSEQGGSMSPTARGDHSTPSGSVDFSLGFQSMPAPGDSVQGAIPYSGRPHPLKPAKAMQHLSEIEQKKQAERFFEYLPKIADPLELTHPDIAPHLGHYVRICLQERKEFSLMAMVQKYFDALLKAPKYMQGEVLVSLDKIIKGIVKHKKHEHLVHSVQYLESALLAESPPKVYERLCQYAVVVGRTLSTTTRASEADRLAKYFVKEFEENPSKDFVRQRLSLRVACELGTPTAVDAIAKALNNWEWRDLALDAMRKSGDSAVPTMLGLLARLEQKEFLERIYTILKHLGRRSMKTIGRGLLSEDFLVRVATIRLLTSLHYSETFSAIQRMIKDPQPQVRIAALQALPKLDLPNLDPFFVRFLEDPDENVRSAVLSMIEQHGRQRSVQALRLSISSKWYTRGNGDDALLVKACSVLGDKATNQVAADFVRLLRNRELQRNTSEGKVIFEVCRQLARLQVKQAVPYLTEVAENESLIEKVREPANQAVAIIQGNGDPKYFPPKKPSLEDSTPSSGAGRADPTTPKHTDDDLMVDL